MKFSIITCTYNSEKYVQKNIDSVKNQTFRDFEHIFIDGFSTDGTVEIIKRYQSEFPKRVKFFQYTPTGISSAMNKGIKKASGEYINHLHSDDSFYSDDVLKKVSNFLKKNDIPDLVFGKAKFTNDEGISKIIPYRRIYQKLRFWLLLLTNYVPHQACFIKKEIFERFGNFDENYKNSMDYEMWVRLAQNKISNKFVDQIICNFHARDNSVSSKGKNNCVLENSFILEAYEKNKLLLKLYRTILYLNSKRKFFH